LGTGELPIPIVGALHESPGDLAVSRGEIGGEPLPPVLDCGAASRASGGGEPTQDVGQHSGRLVIIPGETERGDGRAGAEALEENGPRDRLEEADHASAVEGLDDAAGAPFVAGAA
jgi:hypothetical protein